MAKIIQTADLSPNLSLSPDHREWIYNGLDCCVTLEVLEQVRPQLDNVSRGTYEFSKSLQAPILEMAMRGLLVDQERRAQVLKLYRDEMTLIADQLNTIIKDGIGVELNWRSSVQLKKLFYSVLGLKEIKKRDANGKSVPTVNREALEQLSTYFLAEPITIRLLALRDLDKKRQFLETGIDSDGRMRTSFNIAGTNTGRLASSMSDYGTGTNLQNVDRELRSVFIADPGMKFANLDLEQGDSRNVGALCWNLFVESMGEAYAGSYLDACESLDLHTSVAKLVWPRLDWTGDPKHDRAIADVLFYRQDSYRQMAKKGGHGTNYYGTPRTMARHLKMQVSVLEAFQRDYFRAFPVIGSFDKDKTKSNYHNWVRDELDSSGSITTPFGRRRQFFGRHDDDKTLREAIAYSPQSMTADEIDTGLIRLWRANRVQLMVQVHDSILIQFPEEAEAEIVPWALETLRVHLPLARGRDFIVPTEAKTGWNWGDVLFNKDGTVKENPEGLLKWKGSDSRKRSVRPRLSLRNLL